MNAKTMFWLAFCMSGGHDNENEKWSLRTGEGMGKEVREGRMALVIIRILEAFWSSRLFRAARLSEAVACHAVIPLIPGTSVPHSAIVLWERCVLMDQSNEQK